MQTSLVSAVTLAALLVALTSAADAETLDLTLDGYLDASDAISGTPFAANTPFTWSGVFDTASPDLLPPVPGAFNGFVAYAPVSSTLSVDGATYAVAPYSAAQPTGVAVGIFDPTSQFSPGHYAAGFIQNPAIDGAGIVGDWLAATPPFTVSNLTPTAFGAADFFGVGFSAGPCAPGQSQPGCEEVTTPIPLILDGANYALTLGNYVLNSATADPSDPGYEPGAVTSPFTATLVAAPEPASITLLCLGLTGLGLARRWRA